jgi:hypothetical protein
VIKYPGGTAGFGYSSEVWGNLSSAILDINYLYLVCFLIWSRIRKATSSCNPFIGNKHWMTCKHSDESWERFDKPLKRKFRLNGRKEISITIMNHIQLTEEPPMAPNLRWLLKWLRTLSKTRRIYDWFAEAAWDDDHKDLSEVLIFIIHQQSRFILKYSSHLISHSRYVCVCFLCSWNNPMDPSAQIREGVRAWEWRLYGDVVLCIQSIGGLSFFFFFFSKNLLLFFLSFFLLLVQGQVFRMWIASYLESRGRHGVSQEVIKLATWQYIPLSGICVFDGYKSCTGIL